MTIYIVMKNGVPERAYKDEQLAWRYIGQQTAIESIFEVRGIEVIEKIFTVNKKL